MHARSACNSHFEGPGGRGRNRAVLQGGEWRNVRCEDPGRQEARSTRPAGARVPARRNGHGGGRRSGVRNEDRPERVVARLVFGQAPVGRRVLELGLGGAGAAPRSPDRRRRGLRKTSPAARPAMCRPPRPRSASAARVSLLTGFRERSRRPAGRSGHRLRRTGAGLRARRRGTGSCRAGRRRQAPGCAGRCSGRVRRNRRSRRRNSAPHSRAGGCWR